MQIIFVQLDTYAVIETTRQDTSVAFRTHIDVHSASANRGSGKGTEGVELMKTEANDNRPQ